MVSLLLQFEVARLMRPYSMSSLVRSTSPARAGPGRKGRSWGLMLRCHGFAPVAVRGGEVDATLLDELPGAFHEPRARGPWAEGKVLGVDAALPWFRSCCSSRWRG